jgi:hypothetical protein
MGLGPAATIAVFTAGLAGCHQLSASEKAQQLVQDCAAEADAYLDPHWAPRQVSGVYPAADGVVAIVVTAQGARVTASCGVDAVDYTHLLGPVTSIEGVAPTPGQLYLPAQHRWLTNDELQTRLAGLLAPQPGEYAGAAWAPNPPGVDTVSDPAGVASTACFTLQSKLEPARQLVACQVSAGHRYWVSQGQLTFGLGAAPAGLPAIPPAPPADPATQPGGASGPPRSAPTGSVPPGLKRPVKAAGGPLEAHGEGGR